MAERTPVLVDDTAALRRARCTPESAGDRVETPRKSHREIAVFVVPEVMLTGTSREARRAREAGRVPRAKTKAALQPSGRAASSRRITGAVVGILAQRGGCDA